MMIGELHHLGRQRGARRGATSCSSSSRSTDAGRPARQGLLGRHAPPARPRRDARRRARGAVPRRADDRAWTRAPATSCGTCSTSSSRGGATILLTTQYLEEADRLADDIVVVDHGRVIARGDARSLKRQVGGDQLHVVVRRRGRPRARSPRSSSGSPARAPVVDPAPRSVTAPTDGGAGGDGRARRRARATPASRSRTSGCASPRSTTSS